MGRPSFKPIFTTLRDEIGEDLHVRAYVSINKRKTYTYNIDQMDHKAGFEGGASVLNKRKRLTLADPQPPDGGIPPSLNQKIIDYFRSHCGDFELRLSLSISGVLGQSRNPNQSVNPQQMNAKPKPPADERESAA